jgi:capsular polysaccharide biosynthesis protein
VHDPTGEGPYTVLMSIKPGEPDVPPTSSKGPVVAPKREPTTPAAVTRNPPRTQRTPSSQRPDRPGPTSGQPADPRELPRGRTAPQGAQEPGDTDARPKRHPVRRQDGEVASVALEKHGPLTRMRSRVPWLFRRGLVLIIAVIVTTGSALGIASVKQATYTSDAILLVNPGATNTSPGSSQEAQALAATYAGLIPSDNAVLHAVASATGLSLADVKTGTSVIVVNGTSLLDLRFTAQSAQGATAGVDAMSQAISAGQPVTQAIPAGTLTLVRDASTPISHVQKTSTVVALGLVLGLVLGAVIMIIWERADARFDKPRQIADILGIPARTLDSLNVDSAAAMLNHWKALAQRNDPQIALLSAVPGMTKSTESVGQRFAVISPDMHLRVGGAPGEENGDRVAQVADITVLLVPREARVRLVQQSRDYLAQLGIRPTWALMISDRAR